MAERLTESQIEDGAAQRVRGTGEQRTRARIDEAVIEQIRNSHSLVSLVARRVKLRRAGRGWDGLCPFHQEKTPSFTVSDERGYYHCFGCGAHGDLFRWVQETEGLSFPEAVSSLAGGQLPDARHALPEAAKRESAKRLSEVQFVSSSTAGRWIWQSAQPARGEIVEEYLASRGLNPHAIFDGATPAISHLRFHPRCPVSVWRAWEHPEDSRLTAPAMVAPIKDAEGLVRGVHVTFLAHDGRGKAKLGKAGDGRDRPTRKMFGKVGGNAVFMAPLDVARDERMPLLVGEGIETVWAFAERFGKPCLPIATLSLENLQGGAVKLRDGSLPLWNVQADPDRPPFLLPPSADARPGSPGWQGGGEPGGVTILIDSDMKPLRGQKVQLAKGEKPVRADLNGLRRAEICASLAVQHWRRAGAAQVSAVRPRLGMDFNDSLRRVA